MNNKTNQNNLQAQAKSINKIYQDTKKQLETIRKKQNKIIDNYIQELEQQKIEKLRENI